MRQAGIIILQGLDTVIKSLEKLALEQKHTMCMGRSHGVHAEPTTFGIKMLLFRQAFVRCRARLELAVDGISVGKLSGAVGTYSNIDPEIELRVCEKLDLTPDQVSTQVISRDRHAEYVAVLGIIAGTMDQLATEIRHLQRTEVREVEEPFQKGQKGSSAMPHKRNPILCERITGLSRVVKSNVNVALENITLWHERDISHSSAERVILPDSTITVDYLLDRLAFILDNLHIYPDNMTRNISRTGGLFASQTLLLALIEKGLLREDAYAIVQEHAMNAWNTGNHLKDLAGNDKRVMDLLSRDELEEIFNLNRFLKNIDFIYKKVGLA
jgi:adenylosuccinate lyase